MLAISVSTQSLSMRRGRRREVAVAWLGDFVDFVDFVDLVDFVDNSLVPESRCVYCRKRHVHPRFKPFCSERCRLLDLSKWVDGDYMVPGEPVEEQRDDDEEGEP
jgi:uncharacterized protein